MCEPFKEICNHLKRKKAVMNEHTGAVCKPTIEIKAVEGESLTEPYVALYSFHSYSYLFIAYFKNRKYPYKLSLEKQGVRNQSIGTVYWNEYFKDESEILEWIKRRFN